MAAVIAWARAERARKVNRAETLTFPFAYAFAKLKDDESALRQQD